MGMRKSVTIAALVGALGIGGTALAQHEGHQHDAMKPHRSGPMEMTVEGRLIDLGCFAMGMTGGDKHVRCAVACAGKGLPVGLRTAEGKVFTIALPSPKIADYLEKTARIEGTVHGGSILAPATISLKSGEGWTPVTVPKAM